MSEEFAIGPCPFCGGQNIVVDSCKGLEACEGCKECSPRYHAVVCNYNEGSCGASSGYYPTVMQAIEAWNKRAYNR